MHYVIKADTPQQAKQEILDYLESVISAEQQKSNPNMHDICLVDKLRLTINMADIISVSSKEA